MDESPLLSRPAKPDRMFGEVRPMVPVEVLSIIDAVCAAEHDAKGKAKSRDELINQILREWAIREARKASLIARVARGNPAWAETSESGFGGL